MEITKQDEEKVVNRLAEWIAQSKQNIAILEKIEAILAGFQGRQITAEIEAAIKKDLPSHTLLYQKEYSFYTLSIWGEGIKYERRIHVRLGCFSQNTDLYQETMNMKWFQANNLGYYNEYLRLERYREAVKRVRNWVEKLNSLTEEFTKLQEEMRDLECGNLFSPDLAP